MNVAKRKPAGAAAKAEAAESADAAERMIDESRGRRGERMGRIVTQSRGGPEKRNARSEVPMF